MCQCKLDITIKSFETEESHPPTQVFCFGAPKLFGCVLNTYMYIVHVTPRFNIMGLTQTLLSNVYIWTRVLFPVDSFVTACFKHTPTGVDNTLPLTCRSLRRKRNKKKDA